MATWYHDVKKSEKAHFNSAYVRLNREVSRNIHPLVSHVTLTCNL